MARKAIPVDVKRLVLHEAGYKCGNPACRGIITLDIHHMEYVSAGGGDAADNLLPLCPTCHALHHAGHIPRESVRAWKMLLLSLNEGFDRRAIDLLLALERIREKVGEMYFTSDAVLSEAAALIASNLVVPKMNYYGRYSLEFTSRGEHLVRAWKAGDQAGAVEAGGPLRAPRPTDLKSAPSEQARPRADSGGF